MNCLSPPEVSVAGLVWGAASCLVCMSALSYFVAAIERDRNRHGFSPHQLFLARSWTLRLAPIALFPVVWGLVFGPAFLLGPSLVYFYPAFVVGLAVLLPTVLIRSKSEGWKEIIDGPRE